MQWFKHLSTMSFDPRIKRIIRKYGVEGYGLYCYILESIARNLDTEKPLPDLEDTAEDIAAELKMDSRKVEEISAFMLHQGLFDYDDSSDRIIAMKMIDYLDEYHRKKGGISKIRKALQSIEVRHTPDKLLTNSGDSAQEKEKEIEKEVDKEKPKKHKHGEYKNVLLSDSEFEKIGTRFGEAEREGMIARLDEGIELKGYKYKSHYLALLKWNKKDEADEKKKSIKIKYIEYCKIHEREILDDKGECYACKELEDVD